MWNNFSVDTSVRSAFRHSWKYCLCVVQSYIERSCFSHSDLMMPISRTTVSWSHSNACSDKRWNPQIFFSALSFWLLSFQKTELHIVMFSHFCLVASQTHLHILITFPPPGWPKGGMFCYRVSQETRGKDSGREKVSARNLKRFRKRKKQKDHSKGWPLKNSTHSCRGLVW